MESKGDSGPTPRDSVVTPRPVRRLIMIQVYVHGAIRLVKAADEGRVQWK